MLRQMMRLLLAVICLLYTSVSHAQLPQISNGLSYLSASQNPDGTWATSTAQVETTAATVSVLETLKLLNQTAGAPYTTGVSWLQAQSPQGVNYIAERIHALSLADSSPLITALDSIRGSWGGDDGYETNFLDTSLALQALKSANYPDLTIINPALAYLTTNQNPDGGWGFYKGGASNVYMTAMVSATLQQFPQMTTIAAAVSKAAAYLLAHQNGDGGFGSSPSTVYETALAYAALAAVSNEAALGSAVNYLTGAQSANGSWSDDPYSTALALKALYLSENRPSPPPAPPAGGKITGTVVDKTTSQRLSGVSVVLDSNQLINTVTDASGSFTLADIPAGTQKVNFSLAGYAATSASTSVVENATASLGNVQLVSSYSTGTIAGTISDDAGKPLAGVAIDVSGAWSGTTMTGADGSYSFTYVTPGNVTITVAKTGYQAVTGPGTVYARTTLSFSPRLSTTPPQATTGTLVGRVVDSYWGLPIDHLPEETGVTVTLSGGISAAPDPNNRGYFEIQGLAPNTYQVIVGMNGFTTRTFRVVIMPGVTTDLGTIVLEMDLSRMALTGKVTDATTGAPIPGAEVTIPGTDFTGRADFAGTYAIVDIPVGKEYSVKVSAAGYVGKSYLIGSSPWTQSMDIALVPLATKGSLTGTVVDAASNQPLAGVTLSLVSDPAISAFTDAAGTFTFAAVPKGAQQLTIALAGYAGRTLTTAIAAGAVNNVGRIPLSVTPLSASIQGTVWDGFANAPFAGVEIVVGGTTSRQTATAAGGGYTLDNADPGTVTITATAVTKTGYFPASFTGLLEPNGILVFSPTLTTMPPSIVEVTAQTDKASYPKSDPVNIAVTLRNTESIAYAGPLRVRVLDPTGAAVYETTQELNLAADGTLVQNFGVTLPLSAPGGAYKVLADLYDTNGMLLGTTTKSFGVATSRITVTPTLPAALSTGANIVTFTLVNSGDIAVSNGVLGVTLKDPDGQVVAATTESFTLGVGENRTLAPTLSIPALRFGTYTLSYTQSDETIAGAATALLLPNSLAITPIFDSSSHRIRETAGLTVTLTNTGRFNLDPTGAGLPVTVSVPDAGYGETKTLSPGPAVASAAGSTLLYRFVLPESLTAGLHKGTVTVTLPSGATVAQAVQLAIPESALSVSPLQTVFTAGNVISPVIANSGGVDTQVQYGLSLFDARSALIAEKSAIETVSAGASLTLGLAIPDGAVDGPYNLVVSYKDLKTAKEGMVTNPLTISGVKGSVQVQTGKQTYLLTESITGLSTVTNSGTPLQGGNLHLQVTTAAGSQKQKSWTSQYDFQQGVREGVDTYGVNDWIIPDDSFDATVIDANKWSSGANASIQSGRLFIDTSQGTASSSIASKWLLEGDFDIEVELVSNNSVYHQPAQLYVGGNNSWVNIGNSAIAGYTSQVAVNGVEQSWVSAGNYSDTGRFRITRTADTVVTYYWGGTSWIELNHGTFSVLANPFRVGISVWRDPSYPTGGSATYDNFKVNSGRIKTENQTVDSVRLLPLSDNFSDGTINTDRWSSGGVQGYLPTESNGALKLTIPANTTTDATTYAYTRSTYDGDFDASVDYSVTSPWNLPDNQAVSLALHKPSYYMEIIHWRSPWYSGPAFGSLSASSPWIFTGNAPLQGKLRLSRSGSTYKSYYSNGTGWTNLLSDIGNPDGAARTTLSARVAAGSGQFDVQLRNYRVANQTFAASGTLKLKYDSGYSDIWGKLNYTADIPVGTSIRFRTRTAESESGLTGATWSDYLTTSGSAITSPKGRWIEVEVTLATTDTTITPVLHDLSVTVEHDPGDILWQTDVPVNMAQGALVDLNSVIGALGVTGKLYLQGVLTSSTGQTVASAEYPFYVEQGNVQLFLASDKKVYRPGETVTISGEVKNQSSVATAGLVLQVQGTDTAVGTLYTEAFDLPATSGHPFNFTTTAGPDGIYGLRGLVTQNTATLAETADQYEVASPKVTATLMAPDAAGNAPFAVTVSLNNTGKVDAATSIRIVDDGGEVIASQLVAIPAGESRILQYTRQITGAVTYTAVLSGDLNQTLTKAVVYAAMPTDSTVSGRIVTDKISYNPNEPVTLTSTLSSGTIGENLSALVTVTNSQGQALYSATTAIPIVIPGQTTTVNKQWNTGTSPAGTYLATLQLLDTAGTVIAKATCNLVINSTTRPAALLKGQIGLDRQSLLTGEPVAVSYGVTNTGNVDLSGIALSVQTIHTVDQTVYDTITDQAALAMGANYANSGRIDTTTYSAKDYLVVLRASIGGVEETLAGTYFRVEGAPSAPALSGPANGADVYSFTPLLSVSNAADPNDDRLAYEFEIYADSGLTNLVASGTVAETTGITAWTVPVQLTENQTFYWRARAHDGRLYGPWMAPASFRVNTVDDPPAAPNITSPVDGTAVAVLTPVLTVSNAPDPDSMDLTYNFDLALDPDFIQIVASAKGITGGQGTTSWTVPVSLQENGWYYWRAQADDWLMEGPWSTAARFLVNITNEAPSTPVITAPVNDSTVAALATDLVVTNSTDPDSPILSYYFEADTVPTFDSANIIRSGSVAEGERTTPWHLSGLKDNTRYHLRVRASDGTADSPWSEVTSFVANTVNDPPTVPMLANPSSGAGVNVSAPTLSVHNSMDLDRDILTYEFELYRDAAMTDLIVRSGSIVETASITGWTIPVSLTENQTCYWRARASDGLLYSGWMPMASFMVNTANDAPGPPAASAPADGSSVATLTPTLVVTNAFDPDSDSLTYEFEIYTGTTLVASTSGIPSNGSGTTPWTPDSPLNDNTVYQWRARAFDGDRSGQWMNMATFTTHIPVTSIKAEIEFEPETLNRKSQGTWVKVEIELPHGYRAADIDIASIRLEGTVPAEAWPHRIHGEHEDELTVKFRRSDVIAVLPEGEHVPVHVTGKVGSTPFEGVDIIRVIEK